MSSKQIGSSQIKSSKKKFGSSKHDKQSLKEFKERMKKNMPKAEEIVDLFNLDDFYSKVSNSIFIVNKETGICFEEFMSLHRCTWDKKYPECPERYIEIIKRFEELGLIDRCKKLKSKQAKKETVVKVHDRDLYLRLKEICETTNNSKLENIASNFDSIYFNEHTFEAALYSVGCCIVVAENVCKDTIKNGFAVVRPPGHHAMYNEFCGYCYFNNVAITARHILDQNLAKKILIVDFDVHHGQGTQQLFYDDKRVLYFSIHRYQNGIFWPNLRESNFDFIGSGNGKGFNVNVPLNETKLNDSDYMAIVLNILLPIAYEYQPELILISAGYDSSIGCLEGMMLTTPAFYAHLIFLLSGLAGGKICVCLEGGYFLPSLVEGAVWTLRSLLGDAPPALSPMQKPKNSVIDVINNLKFVLKPYWNCFCSNSLLNSNDEMHLVKVEHFGVPNKPPHDTRNCYPVTDIAHIKKYTKIVEELKKEYEKCGSNQTVCYCYDDDMLLHKSKENDGFEEPIRLKTLNDKFLEFGLDKRCKKVESKDAQLEELKKTHSESYVRYILDGKFDQLPKSERDIYYSEESAKSIIKSAGSLIRIVEEVMNGNSGSGAAFIRPPGHHALYKKAMGFCFVNNVAVATNYALDTFNLKRILILDFDIHHGNGTQSLFYDNPKVLYISVHRFDDGHYFPYDMDANFDKVGSGEGEGFNVNIPLNKDNQGNSEYLSVFHRIILPICYSFAPELVLVSAGFDAGVNDPLGHYRVTPEAFGHFVQFLRPLANGKIVLALEGGYNPTTLAYSMIICVKALLGDPLPILSQVGSVKNSAHESMGEVIRVQKKYWPILEVNKQLPTFVESLTVFDGLKNIEIEKPDLKFLNCDTEKLKNLLRMEQNQGDIDDVSQKIETITF